MEGNLEQIYFLAEVHPNPPTLLRIIAIAKTEKAHAFVQ
jgi:hypothetical protein